MNDSKRKPRKLIRVSQAAVLLQVSRKTVQRMVTRGKLKPAPVERVGPTSPIKLYEAEVRMLAQAWGII